MNEAIHLIDHLSQATKNAPNADYVAVQPMSLARDTRVGIFQHPPSTIEFQPIKVGTNPVITFACGLKQVCWKRVTAPILFEISAREQSGTERKLFSFKLDVPNQPAHRKWVEQKIDLSEYVNKSVTLILSTSVPPKASTNYCWAGWANLCLTHTVAETPRVTSGSKKPHVFLITSDALRADFLGCTGHPEIKTPHLDKLAAEGILMQHARAQTSVTLGSYASTLTGLHPRGHGIQAEWGEFPGYVLSMPAYFHGQGYHSMIATSEAELGEAAPGFTRIFAEQIPCLARPAQEGGITTRQFIKWLDRIPNKPTFAWLQFFDTHPPQIPPEPFKSQYYSGDPSDPANAFDKEALSKVRGIEIVQEIMTALPALHKGVIDDAFRARLRSTAQYFQGKIASGPDLAAHLSSLGPPSWGNRSKEEFTRWLWEQVALLDQNQISPALLSWLDLIQPMLREIEVDILSWLDGVVDYRFPVSQHKASVSYLDHLVGKVIAELKARDLYDCSTIILTSPHGELFGERDIYFHHHLLLEPVLRVPMIIKPGNQSDFKGTTFQPGKTITGIFDSIDLFPTLLDSLGLPVPRGLDGANRWPDIILRNAIEEHPSISVDHHELALTVVSGGFKYMETPGNHELSSRWSWKRGDRALFDLNSSAGDDVDVLANNPEKARELAAQLEAWRTRTQATH